MKAHIRRRRCRLCAGRSRQRVVQIPHVPAPRLRGEGIVRAWRTSSVGQMALTLTLPSRAFDCPPPYMSSTRGFKERALWLQEVNVETRTSWNICSYPHRPRVSINCPKFFPLQHKQVHPNAPCIKARQTKCAPADRSCFSISSNTYPSQLYLTRRHESGMRNIYRRL